MRGTGMGGAAALVAAAALTIGGAGCGDDASSPTPAAVGGSPGTGGGTGTGGEAEDPAWGRFDGECWDCGGACLKVGESANGCTVLATFEWYKATAITTDASYVYFAGADTAIGRMPKAGGEPEIVVADAHDTPAAIAVNETTIFWEGGDAVWSAPLAGVEHVQLTSDDDEVADIQLVGGNLVYLNHRLGLSNEIVTITMDGSELSRIGADIWDSIWATDSYVYVDIGLGLGGDLLRRAAPGSSDPELIAQNENFAYCGVAGTDVYCYDSWNGKEWRYSELTGQLVDFTPHPGMSGTSALFGNAQWVYWYDGTSNTLYRADHDLTTATEVTTLSHNPADFAIDDTGVYVAVGNYVVHLAL